MPDMTIADVKVAVNEAFEIWGKKLIEECQRRDDLIQANCSAKRIFDDKDNVKTFYRLEDELDRHIQKHIEHEQKTKEKEAKFRWLIGVILTLLLSKTLWDFLSKF